MLYKSCIGGKKNTPKAYRDLHLRKVDFTIHTDASESGLRDTDGFSPLGGSWWKHENKHIDYLELKAIFNDLQGYYIWSQGFKDIRIKSDNTTRISYVNNMGEGEGAGGYCISQMQ